MKSKIKKYIGIILTLVLTILIVIPATSKIEASSNHLIVINSRTNKMGYYVNNKLVKEFRVATGKKSTPTPQGKFKIVNKIKNRPYYSGGIPGGDPRNPLGDRWLGLQVGLTYGTTYGIHGNNNESSIGKHISGGCIRMHNKEVRWLFDQIPKGSYVIIKDTNQSFKQIAAGYGINLTDGNEYVNTWKKTDNKWYYYNSKGEKVKGWQNISKKWYYFDSNGVMQTGWKKLDNKWYYLESDGSMRIGWRKVDNKWYYFNEDGSMRVGWRKVDNKWYYFNEDGSMRVGWKKIDNNWYYFYEDGSMATNTIIDGWEINEEGIGKQK